MKKTAALVVLVTFLGTASSAVSVGKEALNPIDQWPNWRGPLCTGAAPHANPPVHWSENKNVKWKAALPDRGSATPIVWGDSVFIAAALDTHRIAKAEDMPKVDFKRDIKTSAPNTYQQFLLFCFERQTGKIKWQRICAERVPHEGVQATHSYAAGSPTTDGKHVWVSFGSAGVYCYDFDGNLKWKRDLGLLYTRFAYGEATTPVLYRDNLILNWDQEVKSKLIILDANTGAIRQQIARDEPTTWNTPLVVEHKGVTQVVLNGNNRVRSYDLKTGQELWEVGGMTVNPIPSAVAEKDVAYIVSGFQGSLAVAVPLDARGDLTGTNKLAWKYTKGTPYVPSPLLVDGKLYFTQANTNLLTSLDIKTGKPLMDRVRLNGVSTFYSSPVAAAGRIYMVDQDGVTLVLKESDKVEVLATNTLSDHIDASPAAVGRQLFLRGHKYLYCIEE